MTPRRAGTRHPEIADAAVGLAGAAEGPQARNGAAAEGRRLVSVASTLGRSARDAGLVAVTSGKWLAETVVEMASHLPVRDLPALEAHHGGLSGEALGEAVIRNACRSSAALGAAAGTLMGAEELLPASWAAVPFELLAETAALAVIEMKLIGELHEVYGQPVRGSTRERGYALARAWAEERGVSSTLLIGGVPAVGDALGRGTRNQLIKAVRRRVLRRTGASLAALGPLMIGAAAGAAVNRRSTRRLGAKVIESLTRGQAPG